MDILFNKVKDYVSYRDNSVGDVESNDRDI